MQVNQLASTTICYLSHLLSWQTDPMQVLTSLRVSTTGTNPRPTCFHSPFGFSRLQRSNEMLMIHSPTCGSDTRSSTSCLGKGCPKANFCSELNQFWRANGLWDLAQPDLLTNLLQGSSQLQQKFKMLYNSLTDVLIWPWGNHLLSTP